MAIARTLLNIQGLPQLAALVAEFERTKNIASSGPCSVCSKVGELLWALDHPEAFPCQTKLHAGSR